MRFRWLTTWLASAALLTTPIGCATGAPASVEHTTGDAAVPMAARLDPIVHAAGANVAVRVIELPSRRELYAVEADRAMLPASNMKLVTTATALDLFGPDHTFETRLAVAGNDLYLVGGGDPALGDSTIAGWQHLKPLDQFAPFVRALRARDRARVKGALYFDDRALDGQWTLSSWHERPRDYWYAAPSGGLNFNDNCIDVTVYPTTPGQPVRYEVFPPTSIIHIVNRCVTADGGERGEPSVAPGAGDNEYVLSGVCAKKTALPSKSVGDPGLFTADVFRTYLAGKGITIAGGTERAAAGPNAQVIATLKSAPLSAILKRVNKPSQNFLAEVLAKQSGERYRATHTGATGTSWQMGEAAAKEFLARSGIAAEQLRAADGSGLSREDRVTARMLTDLLAAMNRRPGAPVFRDSLPIAGVDGTIKGRLTQVKGRVFAKTGSIRGVRALSGYAVTADGRTLAFSILCNDIQGDEAVGGVARIDDIVRAMLK